MSKKRSNMQRRPASADLQKENQQLRRELEAARLHLERMTAAMGGAAAALEDTSSEQVSTLIQERDHWRDQATRFWESLQEFAPVEALGPAIQIEDEQGRQAKLLPLGLGEKLQGGFVFYDQGEQAIQISMRIALRDFQSESVTCLKYAWVFPGALDDAINEIKLAMAAVAARAPAAGDLSGDLLPGLTREDMIEVLSRLAFFRGSKKYNQILKVSFDELWSQIEEHDTEFDWTRDAALVRFRNQINRSFANMERRLEAKS